MKVLIWLLFSLFALNSAEELGQDLNIESSNVFDTSASINPYNWLSGAQNFVSFFSFLLQFLDLLYPFLYTSLASKY